jgi:uncharacterized protein (TIGR02246 family)
MTDALEARVQRLEDLLAIHQLFVDYGEHLDAGDFAAYAALFADDGEILLGPMGRAKGRAAIQELMEKTLGASVGSTRHVVSGPRVNLNGDTATSTVIWTVFENEDGKARSTAFGHHHDELVRVDGRWYFKKRKGTVDLPSVMPPRQR